MEPSLKRIIFAALAIIIIGGIMLFLFYLYMDQIRISISQQRASSEQISVNAENTDVAQTTSVPAGEDFIIITP
ncbi:MAG: hypothetical protein JW780_02610 [Clostridiales bacterium]|nr:hypothetical protein [Clostridiales bacterium]